MNWVQWLGAGILVVVTGILVVDVVAWLLLRILRPQGFAELQEATIRSCFHQDTIGAARTSARQSAQCEALPPSGLGHLEDVRHATVLSYSADRGHRVRWLTFGVARRLQHSFRRSALIRAGIEHKGMAVINVTSPCVTFNRACGYTFYQGRSFNILDKQSDYDPSDRLVAMELMHNNQGQFPLGVLYRAEAPTFDRQLPAVADRAAATEVTLDDVAETFH